MTSMFGTDEFRRGRFLVRTARTRQLVAFGRDPNIIGSGFGQRVAAGQATGEPALVVYVARKVSERFLPPSRLLPRRVYVGREALEVDVVETGPFYPFSFTARERPAPNGISIAHIDVSAGTLGSLVRDNTDGTTCILSNNHVLANQNAATLGDTVTQPGPADGGTTPADDIATLKRFVTIDPAGGNVVDAAIAEPNNGADVVDQVKDDLIPVANPDHPAVGLLFAGSCNRTLMNPIDQVLRQLDVSFLAGGNVTVAPDVGMNVEKVGRTTEYTTSTITEIDVSTDINYDVGPVGFIQQFATAWMSDGGDSGSLVYRGGEGGNEDHCGGCASTAAASRLLGGVDLELDAAVEKEFRSRYLQHTRIGRWAVDLFFANEQRLVDRSQDVRLDQEDQAFARYLYDKYADALRATMLQPFRSQLRLTGEHLTELRDVLGRARQWLTDDEAQVGEELLRLAYDFEGRSAAEVLERLNDEELFRRVRGLAARLPFLAQPDTRDPETE